MSMGWQLKHSFAMACNRHSCPFWALILDLNTQGQRVFVKVSCSVLAWWLYNFFFKRQPFVFVFFAQRTSLKTYL